MALNPTSPNGTAPTTGSPAPTNKPAAPAAPASPTPQTPLAGGPASSQASPQPKTEFVPPKSRTFADMMSAGLHSGGIPNSALNTALLLRSTDTEKLKALTWSHRFALLNTVIAKGDHSMPARDARRDAAIVALMTAEVGEKQKIAKALYAGAPGARLIDRVAQVVDNDESLDEVIGKELRRARNEWTSTYNPPDPIERAQMGTVAASRKLLHEAFPFNDAPYGGISSTIRDGTITATLSTASGQVPLGSPFAIPSTSAEVQAELAKRFNQFHYGSDRAPPAFLNALIKDRLATGFHPGAAIANAVTRTNGNDTLKVDAATWGAFIGAKGTSPDTVKRELIEKSSKYFGAFHAQKLAKSIESDGQHITMPLGHAKVIVEAKQLSDKARTFFSHDGLDPNFEFVRRIDDKLTFVVPFRLASAFLPLTEKTIANPKEGLQTLRERMVDLQLGTPGVTDDGLLTVGIDDAKRLVAASTFSYAGAAAHDVRNLYGGAQLSGLAYMPFESVKQGAEYAAGNRKHEVKKERKLETPPGALAAKLRRLGFEIEREVATPLGQALVLRNDALGLVRVVFRGTDRLKGFTTDLHSLQEPFAVAGKTFLAPRGFLWSVQSMYPDIIRAIQSATEKLHEAGVKDVKLGIDGHSKGGAEGALFAFMAQEEKNLPPIQQVNLVEPARSISRWAGFDTPAHDFIDGALNLVVGAARDAFGVRTTGTAAEVYAQKLGEQTSVWAMSRDPVPHLGLYGFGRVKPGGVLLFDESSGVTRSGVEGPVPEWWLNDPFVKTQKDAFFEQGMSLSSHRIRNVGPTIFDQIGAGTVKE